jgi:archaellum component FlaG (FlaF/FlaG flagellin family)
MAPCPRRRSAIRVSSIISRKNGRRVVFGVIPLPIVIAVTALGAGVALAAILLTTTISGKATINEVTTSNSLDVSATSADGSALKCNVSVNEDNTQLEINPVLTKLVGGGNASGVPIPGGECTLTIKVKNSGDTTIRVDGSSILTVPDGWTGGPYTGLETPIAKGETGTVTAKITANQDAKAGDFGGKLVYTDAAGT